MDGDLSKRAMVRSRRLAWIVLVCAAVSLVRCRSPERNGCRHADECPPDELCRLGSCEPKFGTSASSDARGAGRPNASGDASGSTSGRSDRDGGSAPSDADAPNCPGGSRPGKGELVLNEILPNVPPGTAGDANGDGTRDAFEDEFVEFVNPTDERLDLAGVRLIESGDAVWTIDSVCLGSSEGLVIFGGVAEGSTLDAPDGVQARVSPKRFGLTNSGSTFRAVGADGVELASFKWSNAPPVSYTLNPQVDGSDFRSHAEVAEGAPMSPARCADGTPLAGGCPRSNSPPDAADAGRDP